MNGVGRGVRWAVFGAAIALIGCADDPRSGSGALGTSEAGAAAGNGHDAGAGPGPSGASLDATIAADAGTGDGGPVVVVIDASSGHSDATCAATSSMATTVRQGADIIFAVDSSGSMDDELGFVQDNLNAFSQQIVNSGVDARVIMLAESGSLCVGAPLGSGQCPDDSNAPRYIRVDQEVGSRDALKIYIQSFPNWQAQLREGTRKFFVVITDDDATDRAYTAATFRAAVDQLHPTLFKEWSYSGIFCFTKCADAANIGAVHKELVTATSGVSGDLCLQDFAPVFNKLAEAIVTGSEIACEWDIPAQEADAGAVDYDSVNVRYTDKAGAVSMLGKLDSEADCPRFKDAWYYNADKSKILACPQTCTSMKQNGITKVDVLFGCKSEPPPSIL